MVAAAAEDQPHERTGPVWPEQKVPRERLQRSAKVRLQWGQGLGKVEPLDCVGLAAESS